MLHCFAYDKYCRGRRAVFRSAIASGVRAQEAPAPDKSGCNLFHPVPENLLRDLSPDRPDATESPYTVDAGHCQLEMDFANFTHDQTDGTTTKTWEAGGFNLRIGLLNQLELSLIFDNYLQVHTDDRIAVTSMTQSGVGDFTSRLKINLWGDDGGTDGFWAAALRQVSHEHGWSWKQRSRRRHDFSAGGEPAP